MKGKALATAAILLSLAAVLFTACNKQNDGHTGLMVFVTDENGCTVLDKNGEPLTEEWITDIVYATDENGETYTNINGEKVTVKQTRPVITSVVYHMYPVIDENGNYVTNESGEKLTEKQTVIYTQNVTDKDGNNVMQPATDEHGKEVTEENGQVVTEPVTEIHSEYVTHHVPVTLDQQITHHYTTKKSDTTATTSVLENPLYKPTTTKKDSSDKVSIPEKGNIAATNDWLKGFGGNRNDKFVKVLALSSNSFVALGNTESARNGSFEGFTQSGFYSFVTKYTADGTVKWTCPIGSTRHTRMYDIACLSDGSFIAVGETQASDLIENPNNNFLAVVVKISSDGVVQWYKHVGGNTMDYLMTVDATPDGGFVAGGKFVSTDGDFADLGLRGTDAVLAKFDANGNISWSARLGGDSNESVNAVSVDSNGNIYAACQSNSKEYSKLSKVSQNVVIAKYSPAGNLLWESVLEGTKTEEVNDILADDTGCIFVGKYNSSDGSFKVNRGGSDAFVAHCSADGKIDKIYTYGGIENDAVHSIAVTEFGYAAVGATESSNRDFADIGNKGGTDGFILSISKTGEVEHVRSVAGSGNETCYDICALDGKNFIVVGETYMTDGDFSNVTPAAKKGNGTAFVGKYKIY